MPDVRRTWFKLRSYWKARQASTKWKLINYIICDADLKRSKLLYGLETVLEGREQSIDAFYRP